MKDSEEQRTAKSLTTKTILNASVGLFNKPGPLMEQGAKIGRRVLLPAA